jgi:glycosyltransferase involved in cell wall biosynthesis
MSHRYLEAAATRTLIAGKVPAEMIELFGFAPGIDVCPNEMGDFAAELDRDPTGYQGLVDAAYARLLEVATWEVRSREILAMLTEGTEN